MAVKRFRSKVDIGIAIVLIAIVALDISIIIDIALRAGSPGATTVLVILCIAVIVFILWLLLQTHYIVEKSDLRIVSGPFRWRIPIDQITTVRRTKNPLSSPALSLDRLRIEYGGRRRIMVSPADKKGFLRAIGFDDV